MTESALKPQAFNEQPVQEEILLSRPRQRSALEHALNEVMETGFDAPPLTVKRSLVHCMNPLSMEALEQRIKHPDTFSCRPRYFQCPRPKALAEAFQTIARVKGRTMENISGVAQRFLTKTEGAVAFAEEHKRIVHITDEFGQTSSDPYFESKVRHVVFVGITVLPFSAAQALLGDSREGGLLNHRMITAFEDSERGHYPSYDDMANCPVVKLANGEYFPITNNGDSVIGLNAGTIYKLDRIRHVCSFSGSQKTHLPMTVEHSFFNTKSGKETRVTDWPKEMPHRFGHPAGAYSKQLRALEKR